MLYLDVSCCANLIWINFRPWNKLAVLCSCCNGGYDPHAMECVIAVQGSYVVINIFCDILDKLESMVGYIHEFLDKQRHCFQTFALLDTNNRTRGGKGSR